MKISKKEESCLLSNWWEMKSDIEIAQSAKMEPIIKVAEKLGLNEEQIEFYGKYKCKI